MDNNIKTAGIEYDNSSAAVENDSSELSFVHSLGTGNNRMLVVGITLIAECPLNMNIKAIKFGSIDMLYISNSSVTIGNDGAFYKSMLYYLPNPKTGKDNITINSAGECRMISAGATSLFNVYQGIPERVYSNENSDTASDEAFVFINSSVKNSWAVSVLCGLSSSALTPTTKEITERWKNVEGNTVLTGNTAEVSSEINLLKWSFCTPVYFSVSCAVFNPINYKNSVSIAYDFASKQQTFGVNRLERALLSLSMLPIKINISESLDTEHITVNVNKNSTVKKEGFKIYKKGIAIIIEAADEQGAMYGLSELSEKIQFNGLENITEETEEPCCSFRAVKHNTPWSSYRDDIALSQHYNIMQDVTYWDSFLSMMAENRFNTLTVWTQHPFPYMIRPENFPKATPFSDNELAKWRFLYKSIFQIAKEHGIEVFIVNWNIFVSETFKDNYDKNARTDKMGFTGEAYNTLQIEQYTRECITQVLNEYPELTGIGFTLGEFMGNMTASERQEWVLSTIVEGIKKANRPAKLIYRLPLSANKGSGGSTSKEVELMTREALENIDSIILPIETETKFNWSHGFSSTKLIQVHGGGISSTFWEPLPKKYRMNWMIRNEDFFILRWGQPDFIRNHIKYNNQAYVGGYYIGSECYYPALNYFDKPDISKNKIKFGFERQWLFYLLWGRLLYNPNIDDQAIESSFDIRYGKGVGKCLLEAYKYSSTFPQLFCSYVYNSWDFTSYAEGFLCPVNAGGNNDGKPFLSLEKLMKHRVLDIDYLSIEDYVNYNINNKNVPEGKISPLQLADILTLNAEKALFIIKNFNINPKDYNPLLSDEIGDIRAWSYLSIYFANKLKAGVELQYYKLLKEPEYKRKAIALIATAKTYWEKLITITDSRYKKTRLIHIAEDFSWKNYLNDVEQDIAFVQNS